MSVNFMSAVIVHSDFGAQENIICHCFHFFPFYLPWSDGAKLHIICMKERVKSLRHVRLFATPWTTASQAPPSMGFSRQQYWSELPFPSPFYMTVWSRVSSISLAHKVPQSPHWAPFRACWKSAARAAQPAVQPAAAVVSSPFPIFKKCTSIINNHVSVS